MIKPAKPIIQQLAELPIGRVSEVKHIKPITIRNAVSELRKRGHEFICTERGCVDTIKVTRIK